MNTVNVNKAGLVVAVLMGSWHGIWALLVFAGQAQAVLDFIFQLHFIQPAYVVQSFVATSALMLVALTSALGYVAGAVLAWLWNCLHK